MAYWSGCLKALLPLLLFAQVWVQWVAHYDVFHRIWGFGKLVSFLLSGINFIPVWGQWIAIKGATELWHWPMWQALLVFLCPILVALVAGMLTRNGSQEAR